VHTINKEASNEKARRSYLKFEINAGKSSGKGIPKNPFASR
jgi:hypothetical protein